MSLHSCNAVIVTCIDFRFQGFINRWIENNLEADNFDRVALAGGVFNWPVVSSQIELSKRLHNVKRIVLVNHEDCGAYGEEGTIERHKSDLEKVKNELLEKYPEIQVECYLAKLSGEFERVS